MTKPNNGGPAFPAITCDTSGMTLRDYFAGQALAGMPKDIMENCIQEVELYGVCEKWSKDVACCAYEIADAMLRAREE